MLATAHAQVAHRPGRTQLTVPPNHMSSAGKYEVEVRAVAPELLAQLLDPERAERFTRAATRAREQLLGRRVVSVNSTAAGGGVAELLQTLLAYARGAGVDARWVVIDGDPAFFEITKRIHNHLYGTAGRRWAARARERAHYERTIERNVERVQAVVAVRRHSVAARSPDRRARAPLRRFSARGSSWRCHVGIDTQNEHSELAWNFLHPYLDELDGYVFSRAQFAPPWIPRERLAVIPPSIDPFSAKNQMIEPRDVTQLLQHVGLLAGNTDGVAVNFPRRDGTRGKIERPVDLLGTGPPPPSTVPIVLQASRWDLMKDMRGVMMGFADAVAPSTDAHLVLAGPEARGVADDPEADDGAARVPRGVGTAPGRHPPAHSPRVRADGRRRRGRHRRQRAAALRRRRGAEELRGGVRVDRDRGDVEVPARGRQRGRRHRRPDRPDRDGHARRPARPGRVHAGGVRAPRRSRAGGRDGPRRSRTSAGPNSWATVISSSGRRCSSAWNSTTTS